MSYKLILFLTFLILISPTNVLANMGGPFPPCNEIENPEHYKDLVYNSDAFADFQEWQLKNIIIPCQSEKLGGFLVQVFLQYEVPKSYSPHNLTYSTEVGYHFFDEELLNADELLQFYRDYGSNINDFEDDQTITLFIETTEVTRVDNIDNRPWSYLMSPFFTLESEYYLFNWDEIPGNDNEKLIEYLKQNFGYGWVDTATIEKIDNGNTIRISTENNSLSLRVIYDEYVQIKIDNVIIGESVKVKDYLTYNFIDNSIKSFHYENPKLIENLDILFPNITEIPQIEEFKRNNGITYVEYEDHRLVFHAQTSSLTYDVNENVFPSYLLDNKFKWETFPDISKAHSIIKEKLLVGELSTCTIGTGYENGYTEVRTIYEQNPYVKVNLECDGGTDDVESKVAIVILHSDGTYEGLQILEDYPQHNRMLGNLGLIIVILILILIIYKINNARKTDNDAFFKPTKWKMITAVIITFLEMYLLENCFYPSGFACLTLWILFLPLLFIIEPIGDILSNGPLSDSPVFLILLITISFLYTYIIVYILVWINGKFRKK
jgi:hypothetical protein